ncbi:MAG TPA: serine/threonine-protein kinase, partial [Gemmataceae bacterium]|nr:serine/threonine-protein kinase [Gemmataceae bacterium]
MSQSAVCPQGHRWETPGEVATPVCPVCGSGATFAGWAGPAATPASHPATLPANLAVPAAAPHSTVPAENPSASLPGSAPPGYDILEELGRGGMGVVYKAYHCRLKRAVALKMILGGEYASVGAVYRFRREAESVARLAHPNIVQIYEVGSTASHLPFLVLEYVGGGSLAGKLARIPQPPRQAAETVAVLARAVHFAHEHGVLHRDLKPANVLLAEDGTPKVADFGQARIMADEAAPAPDSATATGEVLGTPAYMAPEQASGVTRAPTTAMDTYALGAILYEMLTGRPPFLAEGPVQTMQRVLT